MFAEHRVALQRRNEPVSLEFGRSQDLLVRATCDRNRNDRR